MQIVTVPSSTSYSNLNTLASISVSKSFVITNHTSGLVSIIVSPTQPADDARGVPLYSTQTFYVEESDTIVWIKGTTGKVVIQDTAEIVSPLDFILFEQTLAVDAGSVRFQAITGATEVATFNTLLPVIGKNRMTQRKQPYYTPVISIATHAAPVALNSGITGGTVVENTRIVAANATAQQQTVSGGAQSERGLPIGTYYLRLHNFGSGAATGVYSLFWEERPV